MKHGDALLKQNTKLKKENLDLAYGQMKDEELYQRACKKWKTWTCSQVELWIYSLNNGKFNDYFGTLSSQLHEQDVKGVDLPGIEWDDIKSWGVNDAKDAAILFKEIKNLTSQ